MSNGYGEFNLVIKFEFNGGIKLSNKLIKLGYYEDILRDEERNSDFFCN